MNMSPVQIYSISNFKQDLANVARLFEDVDTLGGINSRHIISVENKFNTITGKSATLVSSCTNGIYLALKKLDLGGRYVVIPPITFFGVASAVVKAGGIPLYSRVDQYGLMDVSSVTELMEKYRVAAVIPSHINNRYVDMSDINGGAATIIEDAAPAWGIINSDGQCIISSTPNTSVISFSYGKPLSAGEGGMIFTPQSTNWFRGQRYCGLEIQGVYGYGEFDVLEPELKLSSTAIAAAMISIKLKSYRDKMSQAYNIAKYYDSVFGNLIDSELYHRGNHQTFVILSDRSQEIIQTLDSHGIKSYRSHRPLFWNTAFNNFSGSLRFKASAEQYYSKIVHIPCRGDLTHSQVNQIADIVKTALS